MLFVYFSWFAVARLSLFIPCIAIRVAQVQSRTHGFCRTYCVHLILRDGPLYIFVVGSLLFWFHLMQSPQCETKSTELYRTLKLYAIYSCMVSIFALLLAYWHNKLLLDAMREIYEIREEMAQAAPPDTLVSLETKAYNPELFGDEDGKIYAAECPICLLNWEADDVIKVTPCSHAFHEECLGHWLKTARTCALCRQDLTKTFVPQTSSHASSQLSTPRQTSSETNSPSTPPPEHVGVAFAEHDASTNRADATSMSPIASRILQAMTVPVSPLASRREGQPRVPASHSVVLVSGSLTLPTPQTTPMPESGASSAVAAPGSSTPEMSPQTSLAAEGCSEVPRRGLMPI